MDIRVVIFAMGIISANIDNVIAKEWLDLERLFYPIKLATSSHKRVNVTPLKNITKIMENKQENLTTRTEYDHLAYDTTNKYINKDDDDLTMRTEDDHLAHDTTNKYINKDDDDLTMRTEDDHLAHDTTNKYINKDDDDLTMRTEDDHLAHDTTNKYINKDDDDLTMRTEDDHLAHDTTNKYINKDDDDFYLKFSAYNHRFINNSLNDQIARIKENQSVADYIGKKVRLLCWVMTFPENHLKKAMHVKETWGKRCDILLFMSSVEEPFLPTVNLNVVEGRDNIWKKQHRAFQYIYHNYFYEADWFLKAEDDTYVIIENLKYLLNDYNSNDGIYLGSRIIDEENVNKSYLDGGAGYVLSREALRTFMTKSSESWLCRSTLSQASDINLANCLDALGVIFIDTRDKYKRHRFFVSQPHGHIISKEMVKDIWYRQRSYYPFLEGRECCSEFSISFHQVNGNMMYILEYFVYHVRPYGIIYKYEQMYN